METVLDILQSFEDTDVLIYGCRIVTLVALGNQFLYIYDIPVAYFFTIVCTENIYVKHLIYGKLSGNPWYSV